MPPDSVRSARSRHALTVRRFGADSAEAKDTKRALVAAKLAREIACATTQAPTLTREQCRAIADLLTAHGGVSCR